MIYYVEDDSSIRELVLYTLKTTGFEARGFECGKEFFGSLSTEVPELILLDIMLPDEDGIRILKKIRTMDSLRHVPVILLTAKGTEYDKVVGLDSGADDYITITDSEMIFEDKSSLSLEKIAKPFPLSAIPLIRSLEQSFPIPKL